MNAHNVCIFEGRISNEPKYSTQQTANGQMDKVLFSIAVDKALSSAQRQAAKNDPNIQTADFVNCSLVGASVASFKQYCQKGKAITVHCQYATWKTTNQQTGQTEYGHGFNVDSWAFSTQDSHALQNQQGGNQQYNNNGYQQQNNYQQPQQNYGMPQQAPQQNNSNFEMFANSNSPF